MFCQKCGKKLTNELKFCPKCGEKIIHVENMQGSQQVPVYKPVHEATAPEEIKGSNTWIIVIIISLAAVVLIGAGLGTFFFLKGNSEDKKPGRKTGVEKDIDDDEDEYDDEESEEYPVVEVTETTEAASTDEPVEDSSSSITPEVEPTQEPTPEPTLEPTPELIEYILPNSDSVYYTKADLYGMTEWECKLARNEIYARHGRLFKDEDLQSYFNSTSWYYGYISPDDFKESMLNDYEIYNRDLIVDFEKSMGYRK